MCPDVRGLEAEAALRSRPRCGGGQTEVRADMGQNWEANRGADTEIRGADMVKTEVRTLPNKGIDMAKPRYGHCQTSWARLDEQPEG